MWSQFLESLCVKNQDRKEILWTVNCVYLWVVLPSVVFSYFAMELSNVAPDYVYDLVGGGFMYDDKGPLSSYSPVLNMIIGSGKNQK